ncbi:hypothetical protein [Paenibacillus lautus]|uniref:hypothetical protein n=1 Tax=Paenibacillus lautus TaxID=1401 RepID=UPI001C1277EB|nr:hypothetical protein [Paenibacillus lautus]MBU5349339.1 hypothetical protein [Paenibacillus lautus]
MTTTIQRGIAFLLLCSLLIVIPETGIASAAAADGKEKVRHRATYIFDERQHQVTVRTTRISFDTGMKKVNEYDFTDKALLPSHYRFASTNGFNMQDGVVADTPQGLKAYTAAVQSSVQGKDAVTIIYEFDYATLSLRKVREIEPGTRVGLEVQLGLYSLYSEKGGIQYYSLVDNKRMLSGGRLITSSDVTDTDFSLSPAPATQTFGVYCPNNRFTGCYNVKFGGEKGSAVKVTENRVAYDSKQSTATKSFMAGGATIKWKNSYQNGTYQWAVEGTRSGGGKTVFLYKGTAKEVETFVSPGGKYLIIIADPSGGVNKTQAGKVYVYDLKTLKLAQKYDALYKAYVTGIRWASDELYVIEYYFSNPGAYPPSFYYIPEGKHFKIEYGQYRDWVHYWDSFSYDGLFYLTLPVAVTTGKGVLRYEEQPAFHMNGLYYVPLKEFADAFHIQYEVKGKDLLFQRDSRTSKLAVSQSKQVVVDGKVFLPLGQWNKDLGLKVAQANRHVMNTTLQISDELRKTDAAMKTEPQAFQAIVERLQRAGDGSGGFVGDLPYETTEVDRAVLGNMQVVLNHDRSLSIRLQTNREYGETLPVVITSRDYSKVLMELPVGMKDKYQATTAVLPSHVFDDGVVTVVLPNYKESFSAFRLKLPDFDKNRF